MLTIIGIQDEYIAKVNAGYERWSHRKNNVNKTLPGGHFDRIRAGAYRVAEKKLRKLGFSDDSQIRAIIQQAKDVAELERNAECDE